MIATRFVQSARRQCGLWVGVCAVALALPSFGWATDPVEDLRKALRISPASREPDVIANRTERVQKAIGYVRVGEKVLLTNLRSIPQRRRAYFLTDWAQYLDEQKQIGIEKRVRDEMEGYRTAIGDSLKTSIEAASRAATDKDRPALGILIAELGDAEQKADKTPRGKFARTFLPVVEELINSKDDITRQTGLKALGKITPPPGTATEIITKTLSKDSIGPRRLAAYALVDLVRNAPFHERGEELPLLHDVITTAVKGLGNADGDESIRGYCILAIQEAARVISDKFATERALLEESGKKKEVTKEQARVLRAFQAANPLLIQALADSKFNLRLVTLQTLEQIAMARAKVKQHFEGPDALEGVLKGDWQEIAKHMKDAAKGDSPDERLQLRRTAIAFFEQLGADAEPAVEVITLALRDEDRFVRWAATRTIGNLPPASIGSDAIVALAYHLLSDDDPDLSGSAAEALDAFGPRALEAVKALGLVIANQGEGNRGWDAENRIKAMNALASIATPAKDAKDEERARIKSKVQTALPQLLIALRDPEVRIRREAAETISLLGRPDDKEMADQVFAALRVALADPDGEVRGNASGAIVTLSAK